MGLDKGPLREFNSTVTDDLKLHEAWSIRWSSPALVNEYWESVLRPKLVPMHSATSERLGLPTTPLSLEGLDDLWPFEKPRDGVPNQR
jgi:hypothetical protein